MKPLLAISLTVATVFLSGCSEKSKFIGKWRLEQMTVNGRDMPKSEKPVHIEFKSDDGYILTSDNDTLRGKWTVFADNDSLVLDALTEDDDDLSAKYEFIDGKLKISGKVPGGTNTMVLVKE